MKNFFLIILLSTALIACETESLDAGLAPIDTGGGTSNITESIVGSWAYSDFETATTTTTDFMGNTITLNALVEYVSSTAIVTFNPDDTYTVIGDLTYELSTDGVSAGNSTESLMDSGTYTLVGNILTLNSANPAPGQVSLDGVVTVTTLDLTDLKLDLAASSTETLAGATVDIDVVGFADFIRQ